MKRIIIALVSLCVITSLSVFHAVKINNLNQNIKEPMIKIEAAFREENWDTINYELDKINSIWQDVRPWSCLTIPTKQIDEIDVALERSIGYASIKAAPDFIGEFKTVCMKFDHLPKQEGLNLEELL